MGGIGPDNPFYGKTHSDETRNKLSIAAGEQLKRMPNFMKNTFKGLYRPQNPFKYIGNINQIVYRSSWELEIFKWLDNASNVIGWNSEEVVIPYMNILDRKMHRYFPDCFVRFTKNGKIVPTLIEIKPEQFSTLPVKKRGQSQKSYNELLEKYYTNGCKWMAAKKFCDDHKWNFLLLCKDIATNSFVEKNNLMTECIYNTQQLISG